MTTNQGASGSGGAGGALGPGVSPPGIAGVLENAGIYNHPEVARMYQDDAISTEKHRFRFAQQGISIARTLNTSSTTAPLSSGEKPTIPPRTGFNFGRVIAFVPTNNCNKDTVTAVMELSAMRLASEDPLEIRGGMFSLLSCLFPTMYDDTQIKNGLVEAGVSLHCFNIDRIEDLIKAASFPSLETKATFLNGYGCETTAAQLDLNDGEIQLLNNQINEANIGSTVPSQYAYAFSGVIFTMMGKVVGQSNYEAWRTKRWNAFCGQLSVSSDYACTFKALPIPLSSMQQIGMFFSTAQVFRRTLFGNIRAVAGGEDLLAQMCGALCRYLRWTEMNHIGLINQFVFIMHPELIHVKELRKFMFDYIETLLIISKEHGKSVNWCYMKIIGQKNQLEFLSRNRFPVLTALAVEIGKQYFSSLANYQGGAQTSERTRRIVELGLTRACLTMTQQTGSLSDQEQRAREMANPTIANLMMNDGQAVGMTGRVK